MGKHTVDELRQWQALPLSVKERMTVQRIRDWINEYGEDGVYISFSGGKDSTVLSYIVDKWFPDNRIPRMFVNTGLEFPEIVQFVKKQRNVEIVRPKMNFKKVIEKYGYPFISKEVSECVYGAKRYLDELMADRQTDRQTDNLPFHYFYDKLVGRGKYAKSNEGGQIAGIANSEELASLLDKRMQNREGGANLRLARMLNMLTKDNRVQTKESIPEKDRSKFANTKWQFFLEPDAPRISSHCCRVMKKSPAHSYAHKTGRVCMSAEMASESRLRTQAWLQHGCNGFDLQEPKSMPMAFWTEQDVLRYIKENNVEICSVYGEIVTDTSGDLVASGQMRLEDFFGECDDCDCKLRTTGCSRTGCMFCGYGAHLEKPGEGRFLRMKQTHPKIYEWIMKPWDAGGLGYKDVIDWINEHGGTHIEY